MPLELAALIAGAFAAAFVSGAIGFGNALVAAAVWLPLFEPREAVPLIIITGIVMHAWSLKKLNARPDFRRLRPFLLGGLAGAPLGTWLLTLIEPAPFRRTAGVILCAYGVAALVLKPGRMRLAPPRSADAAVGAAAGLLGNFAGLAGILPSLWCGFRGWTPDEQRAVYQPLQLALGLLAATGVIASGLVDAAALKRLAFCLPAVAAGLWCGHALYARLDPLSFARAVLALVFLSGAALLVQG